MELPYLHASAEMSERLTANTTAIIPVGTSIHKDTVEIIAADRIVVGIPTAGNVKNVCREVLFL